MISSHILNNNYLLASQAAAAAAVANFQHPHHPLAPFHPHHPQASPILQNLQLPLAAKSPATLQQIKSIIQTSTPTATIPTQIPSFIANAQHQQQQQHHQLKSINTSSSFNPSQAALATQQNKSAIVAATTQGIVQNNCNNNNNTTSASTINVVSNNNNNNNSVTSSVTTATVTSSIATPNTTTTNSNMDPVGQMGQNPMQSHPLSQSMDSVNTASNEEEVSLSFFLLFYVPNIFSICLRMHVNMHTKSRIMS